MSDDNFGKPVWTQEELDAEKAREEEQRKAYEEKLANGFYQHGISRRIVLDNIEKEEKISQKGNKYVLHHYWLRDVETDQRELLVDRNFAFTNAMKPVKDELGVNLRLGVTVLEMLCEKDGEREYNGVNYPIWKFTLSVFSNADVVRPEKEAAKDDVDVSSIPF